LVSDAELVAGDPERARAVAYERHVTAKIRQALSFIPKVVVEVNASPGMPPPTEQAARSAARLPQRAAANSPATLSATDAAFDPKPPRERIVQVSIAIPEGYLLQVREQVPGAGPAMNDPASTELARLERLVAGLVPISPPWSRAQVTITRFPGHGAMATLPVEPLKPSRVGLPTAGVGTERAVARSAESVDRMLAGLPLPADRSIVLVFSLAVAVIGGLALLLGGSKQPLPRPVSGGQRDAIDWSTLRRPGSFDTHGEAA
jgi:hypothetical protein